MDFTEKLTRLSEDQSKTKLAKAAGLPASAISNYISKKQMPRGDKALSLARAIGVPLDWLLDDQQGWPPPIADSPSVRDFGDADLVYELARRYRLAQLDVLGEAARIKEVDWEAAADAAERMKPGEKMPDAVRRTAVLLHSFQAKFNRISGSLDVERFCIVHHNELPGGDRPIGEFERVSRGDVWWRITQLPGLERFGKLAGNHPEWINSRMKKLDDEHESRSAEYISAVAKASREEREGGASNRRKSEAKSHSRNKR